MPRWAKIVLGIIGGAVVLGAAIVALVFWLTGDMVAPVERQLAALKAGDMGAAYAETSEAFQNATPLPAFVTFIDANPILKDVESHSFSSRSMENGIGTLTGKLTSSTGGVQPVEYRLVKENEAWKILSIDLSSGG